MGKRWDEWWDEWSEGGGDEDLCEAKDGTNEGKVEMKTWTVFEPWLCSSNPFPPRPVPLLFYSNARLFYSV